MFDATIYRVAANAFVSLTTRGQPVVYYYRYVTVLLYCYHVNIIVLVVLRYFNSRILLSGNTEIQFFRPNDSEFFNFSAKLGDSNSNYKEGNDNKLSQMFINLNKPKF